MAGRIPEQFIDDLVNRIDIVDLIESHVPLRKAGKGFQCLCPFHNEKTPSFTISREKQFYHCFGCGVNGTAVGFLMAYKNIDFLEAIDELAEYAGVEVPRNRSFSKNPENSKELLITLEKAQEHFNSSLRESDDKARAIDYLKGRGVSGETAKTFGIGFAPDGWSSLLDAFKAKQGSETLLESAGLIIKKENGGYYDRFRNRIMFPIHDKRGRILGFGGRLLGDGEPKYLNSPETTVFHKGKELYGLKQALASKTATDSLIVVEGYMDVIALHQAGMRNAVATLGTAITANHLDKLFHHAPQVVFCFDGDNAGRKAAWKSLELSLPKLTGNREVRFAFLPDGHDPDSAVRAFGAVNFFKSCQLKSLSEYLIEMLKKDVDTSSAEGKTRLISKIKPYVMKIPDTTHRTACAQRLSHETKFDENIVRQELGFTIATRKTYSQVGGGLGKFASRSLQEHAITILMNFPKLAQQIDEKTIRFLSENLEHLSDFVSIWEVTQNNNLTAARILERFRGDNIEKVLLKAVSAESNLDEPSSAKELEGILEKLRLKAQGRQIEAIKATPFSELSETQKNLMRDYKRK
jgi:DNA primase